VAWVFINEDLKYIIEDNTVKPWREVKRGEVKQWVLLSKRSSHYGAIGNNGKIGYFDIKGENLVNGILSVETDRIILKEKDSKLVVEFYDHDGAHISEVKSISKSRANYYNEVVEYESFDLKLDYIQKLPSLKVKKK